MKKPIHLFSERCSGSNYLEAFIRKNLSNVVLSEDLGWKHFIPSKQIPRGEKHPVVILTRSPFAWLKSIHRNPWHASHHLRSMDFSGFIRSEWSCVWDEHASVRRHDKRWLKEMMFERNPITGERFRDVIEMRTIKHQAWLDRFDTPGNCLLVTYESLIADHAGFVARLCGLVGEMAPRRIKIPRGKQVGSSIRNVILMRWLFRAMKAYEPKPGKPLHARDIDYIEQRLDVSLERTLGHCVHDLAEQERALSGNGA